MHKTNKSAAKIVATFGAAMGTLYFAPSLDADVVDLSGSLPGTLTSTQQSFDFIGSAPFDWFQFNDGSGRTATATGYLNGLIKTSVGNVLTIGAAFTPNISLSASFSGIETFGFRTINGQLGWIQIQYGAGAGSPISYLAAAFETIPGNSILIGSGAGIPEPSTAALSALAALALGASATRRRRRKPIEPDCETESPTQ